MSGSFPELDKVLQHFGARVRRVSQTVTVGGRSVQWAVEIGPDLAEVAGLCGKSIEEVELERERFAAKTSEVAA